MEGGDGAGIWSGSNPGYGVTAENLQQGVELRAGVFAGNGKAKVAVLGAAGIL